MLIITIKIVLTPISKVGIYLIQVGTYREHNFSLLTFFYRGYFTIRVLAAISKVPNTGT